MEPVREPLSTTPADVPDADPGPVVTSKIAYHARSDVLGFLCVVRFHVIEITDLRTGDYTKMIKLDEIVTLGTGQTILPHMMSHSRLRELCESVEASNEKVAV